MQKSNNMFGWSTTSIAFLFCLTATWTALGQECGIINNSASPHSTLRSVDLDEVRWTAGFWKQRFDLVKDVTIPKMWT